MQQRTLLAGARAKSNGRGTCFADTLCAREKHNSYLASIRQDTNVL